MSQAAGPALQPGMAFPAFDLPALLPPREGQEDYHPGRLTRQELPEGRPWLVYFYPRALTSGCTTQACALRDGLAAPDSVERAHGLLVLGVSPDPGWRLKRFAEKERLNFPLLSDEDHRLAEACGVWQEKKLYGRVSMGIVRSSFLMDGAGIVQAVNPKVRAATHHDWLRQTLQETPLPQPPGGQAGAKLQAS
ncbi:redoxin domain-containing protein [Oecophyllibacter saccharovorans]|uniref:redoxin domain-containing protein n=1 Tax=Oecophyllibacter saccharovorans TaxID=2558360 RepID=UPI001F4FB265|nr:redoxin domain-containing protein [Oecophyllibacter saccharovorans]